MGVDGNGSAIDFCQTANEPVTWMLIGCKELASPGMLVHDVATKLDEAVVIDELVDALSCVETPEPGLARLPCGSTPLLDPFLGDGELALELLVAGWRRLALAPQRVT